MHHLLLSTLVFIVTLMNAQSPSMTLYEQSKPKESTDVVTMPFEKTPHSSYTQKIYMQKKGDVFAGETITIQINKIYYLWVQSETEKTSYITGSKLPIKVLLSAKDESVLILGPFIEPFEEEITVKIDEQTYTIRLLVKKVIGVFANTQNQVTKQPERIPNNMIKNI